VISPSWPILFHAPQRADRAEEVMRQLGLRVTYGAHAFEITDDGVSAGSAQQRAADFMAAFTDPSVDVVFSTYGGETAHELLPYLEARRLRGERKAFVGNSDNVWLHQYLLQEAGLSSYYGCTYGGEMGEFGGPFPETVDCLRRALMSAADLACVPMRRRSSEFFSMMRPETEQKLRRLNVDGGWHWLRTGRGRGPLIGAELGVLDAMVDRFDLKLDGCILFWDFNVSRSSDPQEKLVELRLCLAGLADRGLLNRLAGMVVGPHRHHTPQSWAATLDEVLPTATYPVVVNADVGHFDPRWVVPYGREAVLDSSQGLVFPRQPLSD
jgi:muramoyltetrapeptide carboxypeptidase